MSAKYVSLVSGMQCIRADFTLANISGMPNQLSCLKFYCLVSLTYIIGQFSDLTIKSRNAWQTRQSLAYSLPGIAVSPPTEQ